MHFLGFEIHVVQQADLIAGTIGKTKGFRCPVTPSAYVGIYRIEEAWIQENEA